MVKVSWLGTQEKNVFVKNYEAEKWNEMFKGSFTPSDSITLTGKMGMQPILAITVPIKRSKVPPINVKVTVT